MIEYSLIKGDGYMSNTIIIKILDEYARNKKEALTYEDYLKLLDNKEIKEYLDIKYKGITSIDNKEIINNNYRLQELLEVYFMENDITINYDNDDNNNLDSLSLYKNDINNYKVLSKQEEIDVFTEYNRTKDPNLKNEIANHNLRLVRNIALSHAYGNQELLKDAIQDGCEGLLVAIDKFDVTKGYKFSTYATWWIKNYIMRNNMNYNKNIRIPVHSIEKVWKMNRLINEYYNLYGQEPDDKYLADKLDMPLDKFMEFKIRVMDTISLSINIGDQDPEEDTPLFSFLQDNSSDANVEGTVMNQKLKEDILEALSKLSEKERNILMLRYGLNNNRPMTLEEVGEIYNVTRERIRQIEFKSLKKLRRNSNKNLIDYLS